MTERECARFGCKEVFEPRSWNHKYCSEDCKENKDIPKNPPQTNQYIYCEICFTKEAQPYYPGMTDKACPECGRMRHKIVTRV
jgi:hypothetical protein